MIPIDYDYITRLNGYGLELYKCNIKKDRIPEFLKKYAPNIFDAAAKEAPDNHDIENYIIHTYVPFIKGTGEIIAEIINENEGLSWFTFDNGYLYLPERMPWELSEKERSITKEKADEIFAKYLKELGADIEKCRPERIELNFELDWD